MRLEVKIVNEKFKVASASQARKFLDCIVNFTVKLLFTASRPVVPGMARAGPTGPGLPIAKMKLKFSKKLAKFKNRRRRCPPPLRAGSTFPWLGLGLVPTPASPYKKMFYVVFYKIQAKNLFLYFFICFLTKNFSHLSKIAKAKAIDESANMQLCVKGRCFAPRALS